MTVSSRNDGKKKRSIHGRLRGQEGTEGESQRWENSSVERREKDLQSFATLKGTNVAGGAVEGRDGAKGAGTAGKGE